MANVCATHTGGNTKNLEYLFSPKEVAIVGASGNKGSVGFTIFENFLKGGFGGRVYAVNPNRAAVQGKKAYKSILDIKGKIDLAVVVVPAKLVPLVYDQCVRKKVKAVIVISAGFSEIGEKKLTRNLQRMIDEHPNTRVVGPNCIGIFVPEHNLDTSFFEKSRMKRPRKGSVSFLSQSGAMGAVILDWASTQEFGFRKFVSYGNAMDVDEADLLEYLSKDRKTKVITAYLEGAKEGRKFFNIAKRTSLKKPIVVLKGGVTDEAHAATASHTGSLAGSAEVYEAVFRQAGIVRADNLLELFAFAKLLENEPLPKGNRVQIITNGGGFGIVATDAVVRAGLQLAKMSNKNKEAIKKKVPDTVTVNNPIDLTGDADVKRYVVSLKAALADDNVDMVVVIFLFTTPTLGSDLVRELAKVRKISKKPVVAISIGSKYTEKKLKDMEKLGLITFNYPSVAARALKGLSNYAQFLRENKKKC